MEKGWFVPDKNWFEPDDLGLDWEAVIDYSSTGGVVCIIVEDIEMGIRAAQPEMLTTEKERDWPAAGL